jgi:hypothetical protein
MVKQNNLRLNREIGIEFGLAIATLEKQVLKKGDR